MPLLAQEGVRPPRDGVTETSDEYIRDVATLRHACMCNGSGFAMTGSFGVVFFPSPMVMSRFCLTCAMMTFGSLC